MSGCFDCLCFCFASLMVILHHFVVVLRLFVVVLHLCGCFGSLWSCLTPLCSCFCISTGRLTLLRSCFESLCLCFCFVTLCVSGVFLWTFCTFWGLFWFFLWQFCISVFILGLFVVVFSLFAVGCAFSFSNCVCDLCVHGWSSLIW